MRVWLINPNEEVPTDGANIRLRRTGLIAQEFAARGHEVLWWNSTFRHMIREQRVHCGADIQILPNYRIRLLSAAGYGDSISLRRLWHHSQLAARFVEQASTQVPPDLILSAYPLIELSYAAVRYGEKNGVPVVVDLRDMWP
jgi:hypothetical protein